MTKPKHNYSKIFLSLVIPFFSLAFLNSSFFKIKEIKFEGLNPYLSEEVKPILEKIKNRNLLFLNFPDLKKEFEVFPFLEMESFQKVLPNKLIIKFNIQEELGTLIYPYGLYDLYKGGYIFPRFKEGKEKITIESPDNKEFLKEIAKILEENSFIYDYFENLKITEGGFFNFYDKNGYIIEISKIESIPNIEKAIKIANHCPGILRGERVSFLNSNFFIASK